MNKYYLNDISTLIDVSASVLLSFFSFEHKQSLCITQGYDLPLPGPHGPISNEIHHHFLVFLNVKSSGFYYHGPLARSTNFSNIGI